MKTSTKLLFQLGRSLLLMRSHTGGAFKPMCIPTPTVLHHAASSLCRFELFDLIRKLLLIGVLINFVNKTSIDCVLTQINYGLPCTDASCMVCRFLRSILPTVCCNAHHFVFEAICEASHLSFA